MTPLRQQMIAALQLSGKGTRTQDTSVREVRLLAQCYGTSPDVISAQALQASCLHRKNVDGLAPASIRLCSSGIRFFSHHVLGRDWKTLDLMRAESEHRLPALLSLEEVRRLLHAATPWHNRVYFTTVYSCGLRLHEALSLHVSDIDSPRSMIHVHRGKGAKDRSVPLPHDTLALLRLSWKTHRNPTWLFPACGRDQKHLATAIAPMSRSSVQGAFRQATQRAGIIKRDVGVHTLRHAYATHLLEAGVNLRAIQRSMGHAHLETTMLSLHLTHKGHADAYQRIDALMRGCPS